VNPWWPSDQRAKLVTWKLGRV